MRGVILLAEQRKLVSVQYKALQTGQKLNRTSSTVVTFTGVCWKICPSSRRGGRTSPGKGSGTGVSLSKVSHHSRSANSPPLAS